MSSGGGPWIACLRFHGLLTPGGAGPAALLRELARPGGGGRRGAASAAGSAVVWDADRAAAVRGLRPGQPAAEARTACPEAEWRRFDPAVAAPLLGAAWDLLAAAAPAVEPDPDGRPEACAAWAGEAPPRPEVAALQAAVAAALPHVDLAIGLGRGRLVARASRPAAGAGCVWIPPGSEARLLEGRPLELLVREGLLAPARLATLRNLGLLSCGQLAALPEGVVAGRLGREGPRLRALCLGQDARPVLALHPPRTLLARRAWPDGAGPEAWAVAAADLARAAAAGLRPAEGVLRLRLRGDFSDHTRTWPSPRRAAGVLARAAAELAQQAARARGAASGGQVPPATGFLEVALEELAGIAARPASLLPPLFGAGRPSEALDDLLERLPQGALRRGFGRPDRHEALLAMLDPWRDGGL